MDFTRELLSRRDATLRLRWRRGHAASLRPR
jgi:hypothetical protein